MKYSVFLTYGCVDVYRCSEQLWSQLGSSAWEDDVPIWTHGSTPYYNPYESILAEHVDAMRVFEMFGKQKFSGGLIKLFALSI
jgi:hypothetical protein